MWAATPGSSHDYGFDLNRNVCLGKLAIDTLDFQ